MFFKRAREKKELFNILTECVNNVKLSLFRVFHTIYNKKNEHSYESSAKLAGALVNKIFGGTPGNAEAASWLNNNKALVEEEFLNLGGNITEQEDRIVITQATQLNNVIKFENLDNLTSDKWNQLKSNIDHLKASGIFVQNLPQPNIGEFAEAVIRFTEKIELNYPPLAK